MGNQSHRERERLQEIGERAFRAVFDDAAPERLEEVLQWYPGRATEEGNEWGYTVGYDVGAVRVFWSAIQWKFDRWIADEVSSLIANTLDPGCVPDVMAAAVKIDRPYDLRDAVLARLARSMARPEDVPEPVLRLQRAFQAAQRAADAKGGAAGDPHPPANAFVGRYYTETLRGWIGGLLAGHREGMLDTLRRIIHERFGEWMTLYRVNPYDVQAALCDAWGYRPTLSNAVTRLGIQREDGSRPVSHAVSTARMARLHLPPTGLIIMIPHPLQPPTATPGLQIQ